MLHFFLWRTLWAVSYCSLENPRPFYASIVTENVENHCHVTVMLTLNAEALYTRHCKLTVMFGKAWEHAESKARYSVLFRLDCSVHDRRVNEELLWCKNCMGTALKKQAFFVRSKNHVCAVGNLMVTALCLWFTGQLTLQYQYYLIKCKILLLFVC